MDGPTCRRKIIELCTYGGRLLVLIYRNLPQTTAESQLTVLHNVTPTSPFTLSTDVQHCLFAQKIWNVFVVVPHAHQTSTKPPTRPYSVNVCVQQPPLLRLLIRVWANSGGMRSSPHYVFGLSHSRCSRTAAACINGACLYTLQGALCHYVQCYISP